MEVPMSIASSMARASLGTSTGVLPLRAECRGPRTEPAGFTEHLPHDQPVKEHPQRRQVLLDRRRRESALQLRYIGSNMHIAF